MAFLVTCEHGSPEIPDWLIEPMRDVSSSMVAVGTETDAHDSGAIDAAKVLSRQLKCPMIAAKYSPAVVDVNVSKRHRNVLSPQSRQLPKKTRDRIFRDIHEPFRREVETVVDRGIRKYGLLIHLSVHSFATFERPELVESSDRAATAKRTDLGLLYDPSREYEVALCLDWYDELFHSMPMLRVRRNYPRRGVSESLIRSLRKKYAPDCYVGVELQLNRAWCGRDLPVRKKVFKGIPLSLLKILTRAVEIPPDVAQEQEAA